MQSNNSNIVWKVANLKKCQIWKLSEVKKLKLTNTRPTPDVSNTRDCSSSGMKFLFSVSISDFLHLLRFIFTVLYCNIAKKV